MLRFVVATLRTERYAEGDHFSARCHVSPLICANLGSCARRTLCLGAIDVSMQEPKSTRVFALHGVTSN